MASDGVKGLTINAALERIASLVNLSDDLREKDGAHCALKWCDAIEACGGMRDEEIAVLNYFRSNAWAVLAGARNTNPKMTWAWEQPEIAQQILHLRKALNNRTFDRLPSLYRCQILTNLGNQLDSVGRFVEALEYWDRALLIDANFWMAQGNRGYALTYYAKAHYDQGQAAALLLSAHRDLTKVIATASNHIALGHNEALEAFARQKERLEEGIDVEEASKRIKLDGYEVGETEQEKQYRRWCLANRLFLNPLNDLGPHTIAARDVMTLPSFTTKLKEPPSLVGFFNQMKQEFVSARWMYFDGLNGAGPHFSDKDVLLYNTLDYPAYGLSIEKIKVAMRTAYSLFDKIAFFLNEYMKLNLPENDVSFARVWRTKSNAPIRSEFDDSKNWPFRGLYWLSKDVRDKTVKDTTEPDARELHHIRNHLEHKYLKVHELLVSPTPDPNSPLAWMVDDLAYSIVQGEFNEKALRVLKLTRAAMMYLSLGMHCEEKRRVNAAREKLTVAPMLLDTWDDEWKQ
jgi:hypothetical protein